MKSLKGQCLVSFRKWKYAVAVFDREGKLINWDSARVNNLANLIVDEFKRKYKGKCYTVYKIEVTEIWET